MKEICPNLKNKEVAKEFGELKEVFGEEIAHLLWSRNNGYSIDKAPNGADSILFKNLLDATNGDRRKALELKSKVYSSGFLDWFGDWTSSDKTKVSKAVDENGEPKITNNDAYASPSESAKQQQLKAIISRVCQKDGRYIKPEFCGQKERDSIIGQMRQFDPRVSIRRNQDGKWYWTRNSAKSKSMDVVTTKIERVANGRINYSYMSQQVVKTEDVLESLKSAFRGSPEMKLINELLLNHGKQLNIEFAYGYLNENTAAEFQPSEDENGYRIVLNRNKDVIYRNNANLSDYAAQTILHELVHAFTYKALHNSSTLRKEAEDLRQYLIKHLGENSEYGLTDIYEMLAELTNVDFVNKIKVLPSNRQEGIIRRARQFFKKIFNKIIGKQSSAYEDAIDILLKAVDSDSYPGIIDGIKDNVVDAKQSISAQQDKVDAIHNRILSLYQNLYRDYRKQLNKGANRQKREDAVWSTIQELRKQEKKESSTLALRSALQQIGVVNVDPVTKAIIPANRNTILGYLQEQNAANNLTVLSPDQIFDMKTNIIDFYSNLCQELNNRDNRDYLDANDVQLLGSLTTSIGEIMGLWVKAANNTADRVVDENIEKYFHDKPQEIENRKIVAKNWLHQNDMWGDEGRITMFFNYSRNDSPIIRQAFQLIQDADAATRQQTLATRAKLAKAFKKANSILDDALPGNWQTYLMERYTSGPNKGEFTGLFRSAVNRGQFKQDYENFITKLNEEFDNLYGHHYITDSTSGEITNSVDGSSVEDEEWVNGMVPHYIEYKLREESWLCDHAERRYTEEYYLERLSAPYDMRTRQGHGLSPRTIIRQSYINDQINYLLQKCINDDDGLVYPENLSDEDYKKLCMWKDALQDLGNPFDMEGNQKQGEELQIALEIQAWNNWLSKNTQYNTNVDAFDADYQKICQEVIDGKRPDSDRIKFLDVNSEWGIDPRLIESVFGNNPSAKDYVSRMFLNSIKRTIKSKSQFEKDFHGRMFKQDAFGNLTPSDMFFYARRADIQNNASAAKSGVDPDAFKLAFHMYEVPYTDPSGMCLAKDGVTKFDIRKPHPGLEAMTWFEYILEQYTDAAMDGRMPRYVSLDGSIGVDFSTFGGDRNAVKNWIHDNILTYTKTWVDKKTHMPKSKVVPLTIFSVLCPNNLQYLRYVPKGRYSQKAKGSPILNDNFSDKDKSGVQPKFSLYGDAEFTKFLQKGGARAEYYKLLLDTMDEQWRKLGLDPSYNRFKLPQVEASKSQKAARAALHPQKYAKNQIENAISATSDDTDMRSDQDFVNRGGKWVLKSAPMRYINELNDPNMINSDLAGTVGDFAEMANNYINKSKIQSRIEILGYALSDENRSPEFFGRGTRQKERFDKMAKQLFYEQKNTNEGTYEKPSKKNIAATKALDMTRGAAAWLMLAYNLPSMFTGFGDALVQMPSQAARGERFGFKDLFHAFLCNPAAIFRAIQNMGNPIANCKQIAMMQKDGLVKTNKESYTSVYKNRLTKALSQSATGGYTVGDYLMNMLAQRAMYNAKKYYPGDSQLGIPEGFYLKEEFEKIFPDGYSKKQIENEFKVGGGITLWNAYYYENGTIKVKKEYQHLDLQGGKMSGSIQQLMALINGNAPKNDQSAVSNNIVHKFFFLMRNFIIRRVEHWFAGSVPDNIVKEKENVSDERVRGGRTYRTEKTRWKPLTNEQKQARAMYDYSTGMANPAVMVSLLRGATSQLAIWRQCLFNRYQRIIDPRHYNKNEVRALREFVTWGLCLALLTVGWMSFHRWVQKETDDLKPDDYEKSLPSIDNFIKQKVYLKMMDQVGFRLIDSQSQLYNAYQLVDIIKTATTATSAVEKEAFIMQLLMDASGLSRQDPTRIINSDSKYKYFPAWQRDLWMSTPLNNIQTWSSWRGNEKVGSWYFDNTVTGAMFKAGGYTWKGDDDKKDNKEDDSNDSGLDLRGDSGLDESSSGLDESGDSGLDERDD